MQVTGELVIELHVKWFFYERKTDQLLNFQLI